MSLSPNWSHRDQWPEKPQRPRRTLTEEHKSKIGQGQKRNRAVRDAKAREPQEGAGQGNVAITSGDATLRCDRCRQPRDNAKAHSSLCPICAHQGRQF